MPEGGAPAMRAAVYWGPALDDPLRMAGNGWLGRDPQTGGACSQPDVAGIGEATAAASVYGFHATLRAPIGLATGWDALLDDLRVMAAGISAFDLPRMRVGSLDRFLTLQFDAPCPAMRELADACVMATDRHRRPASGDELRRRRNAGLSAVEESLLVRFGYPYVMQAWRFHMTLTRRLSVAEMDRFLPAAERHFAAALAAPRRVREICVFTQMADRPLLVAERLELGPAFDRRI